MSVIATIEQLEAIYGYPNDASTVKVADRVTPAYRVLIDQSPIAVLATCGPEGLDCSPRGDLPGFVRVDDEKTLMMPDRRGNNRVDSLRNIVRDPRIALLFLIPGSGSTLRVNGRAYVSLRPVESRQAGRPQEPADAGPDFGGDERQSGRRRGLRPGLAGTRAAVALVGAITLASQFVDAGTNWPGRVPPVEHAPGLASREAVRPLADP
jgi:predicted pyridoxine 5'-phosphate oxidase superfamily flavin-nucleotide-binding protein